MHSCNKIFKLYAEYIITIRNNKQIVFANLMYLKLLIHLSNCSSLQKCSAMEKTHSAFTLGLIVK